MATKRAHILDEPQYQEVCNHVHRFSRTSKRDLLFLALSYRGGLRACEIAGLEMRSLLDPQGYMSKTIEIFSHATKNGSARSIPMHPEVSEALVAFRHVYPRTPWIAVSPLKGRQMSANAVTLWFWKLYRDVRLRGCSSHSGRRTFITGLGRTHGLHGMSLVDVQRLAGHARLETTQAYIEPSQDVSNFVASLGKESLEHRRPHLGF